MQKIRIGISTCPNDIFAFYGIMSGSIDLLGLEIEMIYLDVQQLNEQVLQGVLDIGKVSFHAALYAVDRYGIARAGSAIGEGVGPLLLSATKERTPKLDSLVLAPGALTTATLLFRLFYPEVSNIEQRVFSDIMPALKEKRADFGVVIHEGRFTYPAYGLELVEDLGSRWESLTNCPLPLGGIAIKHSLGESMHRKFVDILQRSIKYGYQNRDKVFYSMSKYAQEMDPAVIWSHVELYVNDLTYDLGDKGAIAINELQEFAHKQGVISNNARRVQILG